MLYAKPICLKIILKIQSSRRAVNSKYRRLVINRSKPSFCIQEVLQIIQTKKVEGILNVNNKWHIFVGLVVLKIVLRNKKPEKNKFTKKITILLPFLFFSYKATSSTLWNHNSIIHSFHSSYYYTLFPYFFEQYLVLLLILLYICTTTCTRKMFLGDVLCNMFW